MFAIVKITHIPPDILHLERMVGRHRRTDRTNMRVLPGSSRSSVERDIEGFRVKGLKYFEEAGQITVK
jgi:hypothetical protein